MVEYISVAEYAKRAGISKAQAYNAIRSPQNKPYIQEIDGMIQVSTEILKPAERPQEAQEQKPADAESPVKSPDNRETAIIDFLMKQIEELQAEVKDKDRQIAEHNARITSLLEREQELSEKALQVATQAQYLQALPQQKKPWYKRLIGGKKEKTYVE